jgi:IS1 family transposase
VEVGIDRTKCLIFNIGPSIHGPINKLPIEKRAQILSLLVEGASLRSISRVADVSINTVTKLLVDAGTACAAFHDERVRGFRSRRVQVDEVWSFCYAKQKNVPMAKAAPTGAGDLWTWTALDADTKLMCSWVVGARDAEYAMALVDDLRSRLVGRVQLTTDGLRAYLEAVEDAFGDDVDYAQLVKLYGAAPEGPPGSAERKYSPGECIGYRKVVVSGRPDKAHVSTSYVERHNLIMRMSMKRFTRLINAFSKKLANHEHSLALYFTYHNFVRVHDSLRVTPAMAARVSERLWSMEDLVRLIDQHEAGLKLARRQAAPAKISN